MSVCCRLCSAGSVSLSFICSFFFFFSSRRRHTRCLSDWSSDVCSSDLYQPILSSGQVAGVINVGDAGFPDASGVAAPLAAPQAPGAIDDRGNPFILVGYLDTANLARVLSANANALLSYAGISSSGSTQVI